MGSLALEAFVWLGTAGLVIGLLATAWILVFGGWQKPDAETEDSDFDCAMARWSDMQARTEEGR